MRPARRVDDGETVAHALTNVGTTLAKLGVSSRREAGAALARIETG